MRARLYRMFSLIQAARTLAVQLHGRVGVTQEYPVEMFLRDAAAMTIADGENAFLAQVGASLL